MGVEVSGMSGRISRLKLVVSRLLGSVPLFGNVHFVDMGYEPVDIDEKVRVAPNCPGLRLLLPDRELIIYPDRAIGETPPDFPQDWLLASGPQMRAGIYGTVRISRGKSHEVSWDNKELRKLFGLSEQSRTEFILSNDRGDLVISPLNGLTDVRAAKLEDPTLLRCIDELRHKRLARVEELYGGAIKLLSTDEALATAKSATELFRADIYRPKNSQGRPGGVLELPANLTPIILGDLHAQVDNLLKLLCENRFLKEIENGRACLVLLGDVVHREGNDDLEEMDSSALMLDLIFKLKQRFPEHVFMLRGNHESFTPAMSKGGVLQGALLRKRLKELRGQSYVTEVGTFFDSLPYMIRSDQYVAAHAGPTRAQVDYQTLIDVQRYPGLVHELTWNRLRLPTFPAGYVKGDVKRFRQNVGVEKDTAFIVGHTPLSTDATYWTKAGNIKRHFIVYSARREKFGVITKVDGRMIAMDYLGEPLLP